MTTKEAKEILIDIRPQKPRKDDCRKVQSAIDVAVHCMEFYETYMSMLKGSKG